MQDQPVYQLNREIVLRLYTPVLDEMSGLLKFYFTLSTGAVVLFTNLFVQSHSPRLVSVPLVLSILAFGTEAAFCLRLLLSLASFRLILTSAVLIGEATETAEGRIDAWRKRAMKQGQWLERLFWVGMALAGIFVVAVFLGR
jgi:hypothetical protein